jgi:2-amino-4-hydroxy-6-hydroxymethyldihydropteridine diphosphokinase
VHTRHSALDTLSLLLHIEKKLGRNRDSINYESRTIDLDILFYNNSIIRHEQLKVPHPKMHHRLFTLAPLNEIAPEKKHPVLKQTISALKEKCEDPLVVNLFNPVN